MPPLAGRIASAGLAVAALTITVLAAFLYGDMSRETSLSREVQALLDVKAGLDSLRDDLHRFRFAVSVRPGTGEAESEVVAIAADLDYLGAKAVERPDVAAELNALQSPVRDYLDEARLALPGESRPAVLASLEEARERAFRSIGRAAARTNGEVHRLTNAQIRLWGVREFYVRSLVAGTIAVLIGLGVSFRLMLRRARRDAARIEQLAHYDSLTGLPNRGLLEDRLARTFALARRNDSPMAVLLFDLDGFKAVNDELGHAAGDALLVGVAQRARECVRDSDTAGRLGGDEFLVLLPDTDREGARLVAAKLLEAIALPFPLGAKSVRVSASIGGSFLPGPARSAVDLVREADGALYESKREGRNRYTEAAGTDGPQRQRAKG